MLGFNGGLIGSVRTPGETGVWLPNENCLWRRAGDWPDLPTEGGGGGGSQYPTCTNGLLLGTIVTAGTYVCTLGNSTIEFNSDLVELDNGTSYIDFVNSSSEQQIQFKGLNFQGFAGFSYTINSTSDTYTGITQALTQDILDPPPLEDSISASVPNSILSVTSLIETDTSQGPPDDPTLTGITHTITKTTPS
jgi:hypothetical protein